MRKSNSSIAYRPDDFGCSEAALGDWLKRRALFKQSSGGGRTIVVADSQALVLGCYAPAAGAVSHPLVTSKVRRK